MRHARTAGVWTALAVGVCLGSVRAQDDDDARWVRQRVGQVRDSERSDWKKIPWVASIVEARRLSGREGAPVFLFTHDGNIETGRC